eukprot:CAMPEP_0174737498 /NCGR_PEP_ID=MMETSP1094-20130205/68394_1 /TAXON_ID=156173 /ORGANISM="Chrysochromulina brevifilum, Strain UTEX LB 985" /LENGTH=87 /DNA_ID=CAMNT_0015940733 /DNA_START=791 /DNA_END=1053 /DNA_ORIENTATION=-
MLKWMLLLGLGRFGTTGSPTAVSTLGPNVAKSSFTMASAPGLHALVATCSGLKRTVGLVERKLAGNMQRPRHAAREAWQQRLDDETK